MTQLRKAALTECLQIINIHTKRDVICLFDQSAIIGGGDRGGGTPKIVFRSERTTLAQIL
jgi:hypothetical protein